MKYSSLNRGIPAGNPIANALVVIVGALAIGASIVLGFFAFVVLGSIVLVLGAIIALRVWWFNRRLGKQASRAATAARAQGRRDRRRISRGQRRQKLVKSHSMRKPISDIERRKRRQRRRIQIIVIYTALAFGLAWFLESQATTTVIFVRHAEKMATARG